MSNPNQTVNDIKKYVQVLYVYRLWVFGALLLGILAGSLYGLTKGGPRYNAEYIIAAEQEKSSGWENLLAQFGMEVGGTNPGGVFVGESLVRLFTVRSSVEKALLLPYKGSVIEKNLLADMFF